MTDIHKVFRCLRCKLVAVMFMLVQENATMLQRLHYHEHKVRALLLMPPQVSLCVCPEITISEDDDVTNISSDIPLITSVGNGRKKFVINPKTGCNRSTKYLRHDEDICLLTWQCLK